MMPSPTRTVSTSPRPPLSLPVRPNPAVARVPSASRPKTPSSPSVSPPASTTTSPAVSNGGDVRLAQRQKQKTQSVAVPPSPPPSSSRKRAASELSNAQQPRREDEKLGSGGDGGGAAPRSGDSLGSVCLCPPDPKIPRPRNAFMLYRQHFQAAVVARNPGLANPEISKIIGKQWREEDQDVKDTWDDLAEKEKIRHHQQYPNYKYQPRRKGNKRSPSSLFSVESSSHARSPPPATGSQVSPCVKCGRRNLATPATPLTPFTSAPLALPPPTPSTGASSSNFDRAATAAGGARYLPPVQTPMSAAPGLGGLQRRAPPPRFPLVGVSGQPMYPGQMTPGSDEMDAMAPITPDAKRRRFSAYHGGLPPPHALTGAGSMPPAHGDRRESLPRVEMLGRQMQPPPRPGPHLAPHTPQHDPTLTLPPLQTANSSSSSSSVQHTRSVEAMVMTIPFLNKIRVLSRISPPLAPPGPTSPVHRIRGAIIAIDGEDQAAVQQLTQYLEVELSRAATTGGSGGAVVRIMQEAAGPYSDSDARDAGFVRYLQSIAAWHRRSKEMVDFITTPPSPQAAVESPPSEEDTKEAAKPRAAAPPAPTTPVMLVPGYMLTRSNLAATRIPINDAYAPVDHWQWAATLWRGIVGADLTIWIRECSREEMARAGGGGVEVREAERALVVRRESGVEVEAKALRRLGFEVSEMVRGVALRRMA